MNEHKFNETLILCYTSLKQILIHIKYTSIILWWTTKYRITILRKITSKILLMSWFYRASNYTNNLYFCNRVNIKIILKLIDVHIHIAKFSVFQVVSFDFRDGKHFSIQKETKRRFWFAFSAFLLPFLEKRKQTLKFSQVNTENWNSVIFLFIH